MKKKVSIDEKVMPEVFFITEMVGIIKLGYTIPMTGAKPIKTLDALKTMFKEKNVSIWYKEEVERIFDNCEAPFLHPSSPKNKNKIKFDECEEVAEEYGFIKENEPDMPDGYEENYRHKIKKEK